MEREFRSSGVFLDITLKSPPQSPPGEGEGLKHIFRKKRLCESTIMIEHEERERKLHHEDERR